MYNTNIDGYKVLFYIENLLRDYIVKYLSESKLPTHIRKDAEKNAENNGIILPLKYNELLQFLHIGQLYDLIKSKDFKEFKNNTVDRIDISSLVKRRNNIMHSRIISAEQFDEMTKLIDKLILLLDDHDFLSLWNRFINDEINDYSVPLLFVEYPLGKNFNSLIGRGQELLNLKKAIDIPTPVSIIRHGGVGKTALVLQLIEDLLYAPNRPFDRIYFMSFKNTVFNNGQIKKLEKVISNHRDLIYTLAQYMEIDSTELGLDEVETKVWENMFSHKSLLVLDNLETEIVKSNLAEFTKVADLFLRKYTNPSRLIITSRYGLGDREQKFPLFEFDLNRTKELVYMYMLGSEEKLKNISHDDWEWVQKYTQGNPGLIISFCNTFRSTRKSLMDLRVEYDSKYSAEARELHDNQDTFLEFCFENTIESMPKESQIFLSALCYLCDEAKIDEVSEELFSFLIEEIKFERLGLHNLRPANYVNIGFLQPIIGSDKYFVNQLFIEYLNGNYAENKNIFTVFDLKKSEWFIILKSIRSVIVDIQFDEALSVGQLIARLLKAKYNQTADVSYLYKAFISDCNLENLVYYYDKAQPSEAIRDIQLLDKVRSVVLQNKELVLQERAAKRLVQCLFVINQMIKTKVTRDLRQSDLNEYFNHLEKKLWLFRSNNLSLELRKKVCEFLISINSLSRAEHYLSNYQSVLPNVTFELYTKALGHLANSDKEQDKVQCEEYVSKCNSILASNSLNLSKTGKARFYIFSARYFMDQNPKRAMDTVKLIDKFPIDNNSIYSLHLEALIIRIQCSFVTREKKNIISDLIEQLKALMGQRMYQSLFPKKRQTFIEQLGRIERHFRSYRSS
ncbi:hypothetical protein [Cohnella sp. AR92]|uniref:hypothetical protein n=1 Tax=Cohnella sp. AR92 TaxID=648716 RepID=UPI000F8DAE1B|nr:hypothetical protein [Cohnella sp. AR92]RUS47453.1 hypothetical protein ELR57_10065 [Cohnella sp. AR92]